MTDSRKMIVWTVVGLLTCASALHAQVAEPDARPDRSPMFGVVLGAESVPPGMDPTCEGSGGRRPLGVVGAFLAVPVGPLELQGHMSGHLRPSPHCVRLPLPIRGGTVIEQVPDVPAGGFAAFDVRVRWVPGDRGRWVVSGGGGWAGSGKSVPYLTTSVGVRGPGESARWGVDLELTSYRVPWTERTREFSLDSSVATTSLRRYEEWAPTVGVRFVLEVPVVRGR